MSEIVISPSHFQRLQDPASLRKLFKAAVRQVEIEVFIYCNRTCRFCPNSHIDRRSGNNYMDEAMYLRIVDELGSIDYDGVIAYSRYNEPLADRIILKRIAQARASLPSALLSTHSNGDFLTRDYLDELRDAGLDRIVNSELSGEQRRLRRCVAIDENVRKSEGPGVGL